MAFRRTRVDRSVGPMGWVFVLTHPLGNPWVGARILITQWGGFLDSDPPIGLSSGLPRTQSHDIIVTCVAIIFRALDVFMRFVVIFLLIPIYKNFSPV
jgi:hypothetical protein